MSARMLTRFRHTDGDWSQRRAVPALHTPSFTPSFCPSVSPIVCRVVTRRRCSRTRPSVVTVAVARSEREPVRFRLTESRLNDRKRETQ